MAHDERTPDERLRALFDEQHGVASRTQADACGLTRAAVRHRVDSGRLERAGRCLRLPGAPEVYHQQLMVGILELGEGAVVADLASAALLELDTFAEGPLEYLVPFGHRGRVTSGVVRTTQVLRSQDSLMVGPLPCLDATTTIVRLAGLVSAERLEHAIDSALRDRRTALPLLRERFGEVRAKGRTGVTALERALAAAEQSVAHTVLERSFLRLLDRHGVPRPSGQVWVTLPSGRRRLDFAYEAHDVVIELFSQRWHSTRPQRRADAQRLAELHAAGKRVRAFWSEEVQTQPAWVAAEVRALLGLSS